MKAGVRCLPWISGGRPGRSTPGEDQEQVKRIPLPRMVQEGSQSGRRPFTAQATWLAKFLKRHDLENSDLVTRKVEAQMEESGKQFGCDECGKRLGSQGSLQYHLKIHSGERPFVCSYCPKDFRGKKDLEVHERNHTGEKPFCCKICGYSCSDKSNMKKHEKVHSVEDLAIAAGHS